MFDPDEPREIECPTCEGEGFVLSVPSGSSTCPDCAGEGWRDMTQDEINDAAADAWSALCESEPPMSAAERHWHDARWLARAGVR